MSARKGITGFTRELLESFDLAFSVQNMRDIGVFANNLIRVRTRLGYGVAASGAKRKKLAPLYEGYVNWRRGAAKSGDLSTNTTPKKSNLTFTGQLLDSTGLIITKDKRVSIGPRGRRSDGGSNEEIGAKVSKTRPWNNLSDLEIKQVTRFAGNGLTTAIKRRLTR